MSHAMTACPKLSFRAPLRVGDAVVGIGNADEQHQRVNIPAHARTAHQGSPAEKDWERISAESSFMHPPPPPTTQSVKGLNWIVLVFSLHGHVTQPESTNGNKRTCCLWESMGDLLALSQRTGNLMKISFVHVLIRNQVRRYDFEKVTHN